MHDGFMLMYKDHPVLQVLVHSTSSFPLLRSSPTLCYFMMVWNGLPVHRVGVGLEGTGDQGQRYRGLGARGAKARE